MELKTPDANLVGPVLEKSLMGALVQARLFPVTTQTVARETVGVKQNCHAMMREGVPCSRNPTRLVTGATTGQAFLEIVLNANVRKPGAEGELVRALWGLIGSRLRDSVNSPPSITCPCVIGWAKGASRGRVMF